MLDCFVLEDEFPKSFTGYEERPFRFRLQLAGAADFAFA